MTRRRITIEGIDVEFPFEPYEEQIQYMGTILRSLSGGTGKSSQQGHAVLESPTGSGKTLALLCSVCAWIVHQKKQDSSTSSTSSSDDGFTSPLDQFTKEDLPSAETDPKPSQQAQTTRILFTTRTHSQVAQAVKEFRRSGYDKLLASCILGSREHMCVEPRVAIHKKSPTMIKAACRHLCNQHKCKYRQGVTEKASQEARKSHENVQRSDYGINDIEELQAAGKKSMFCPFFYTREVLLPTAEIIFCPYNYVLDPNIASQIDSGMAMSRQDGKPQIKSIGSFLENAILIIDEAHNLPSTCLGVSSIDLSTKDLDRAVFEASKALDWAEKKLQEAPSDIPNEEVKSSKKGAEKRTPVDDAKELHVLCKLLCNIEKHIESFPITYHEQTQTQSHHSAGDSIYTFLSSLNIHSQTSHFLTDMLERTIDTIVERSDAVLNADSVGSASFTGLQTLLAFIRFVFPVKEEKQNSSSVAKCDAVRCALRQDELKSAYSFVLQKVNTYGGNSGKFLSGKKESAQQIKYVLSLWCLDASLTMQRLDKIVRNIIVTSGTLSPISSFVYELKIPFAHIYPPMHTLQKTSVLKAAKKCDPSQRVCVSVCPRGCCDTEFNSSYTKRDTIEYKSSLGNSMVNLFRIIPDGVLIFFPSYSFMRNVLTFWGYGKGNPVGTVWESMQKYKTLCIEETNRDQSDDEKADLVTVIERYRSAIGNLGSTKGAALFAVCRGRLSEGIDFADALARGVIIVGIPYMNVADLNVFLRKKYFDDIANRARKSKAEQGNGNQLQKSFDPAVYLTGDVWYQQESMRAVNQAMGRAIRHKHDYGAIVLLDSRFRGRLSDLSAWTRPYTEVADVFSDCTMRLAAFFRSKSQYVMNKPVEETPRAKTATKRDLSSFLSAQSAVQYERDMENNTQVSESPASTHQKILTMPQVQPITKTVQSSQISLTGSVKRSSSAPRSFFGASKKE